MCSTKPKSYAVWQWLMAKLVVKSLRVEYDHFRDCDIPSDGNGISDEDFKGMLEFVSVCVYALTPACLLVPPLSHLTPLCCPTVL